MDQIRQFAGDIRNRAISLSSFLRARIKTEPRDGGVNAPRNLSGMGRAPQDIDRRPMEFHPLAPPAY